MEKEIQRKYMQYQLVQQQLKNLIEQKVALDEKKNEVTESLDAVKKIEKLEKNNAMWSSLGSGVFISSNINSTDKFLVSIGANVAIKKNTEDAVRILEERLSEIEELDDHIISEINKYGEQMQKSEQELQKLVEASESKK